MTKITPYLYSLIVGFILSLSIQSDCCYADPYIEEIQLKCSPTIEAAKTHIYPGLLGKVRALLTKGIKIVGQDELIMECDELLTFLYITAICFGSDNFGEYWGEKLIMLYKPDSPFPSLCCQKGEGIKISFKSPNSPSPVEFQYIGEILTTSNQNKANTWIKKNQEQKSPKQPKQSRTSTKTRSKSSSSSDLEIDLEALSSFFRFRGSK